MLKKSKFFFEKLIANMTYFRKFLRSLSFTRKCDQKFAKKFNRTTNYSSWSIQNQILSICAQMVRDKIILEVQTNGFFALMCDEAR